MILQGNQFGFIGRFLYFGTVNVRDLAYDQLAGLSIKENLWNIKLYEIYTRRKLHL